MDISPRQDDVQIDVRISARLRADHDRVALNSERAEESDLQNGHVVAVAGLRIERGFLGVAERLLVSVSPFSPSPIGSLM